jgi:DNA polymerase
MALPGTLRDGAAALALRDVKDDDGHRLMMQMAKPRGYNEHGAPIWWDDEARIRRLVQYCKSDVAAERGMHGRVDDLPPIEQETWLLDQEINDRGVKVDTELADLLQPLIKQSLHQLDSEMAQVTGGYVTSTSTVAKLTEWLRHRGIDTDNGIAAWIIDDLLLKEDLPSDVRRALEIRLEAGLASVKKINALLRGVSSDGRARGMLQYHAASTGRWAGRRFQPQNIKRPTDTDQDGLIEILRTGSISTIEMLAGPPLEVISDVLRGLIIAEDGKAFFVGDFSAIESRVLAWLAGEEWKLQAFRENKDIYTVLYRRAFGLHEEQAIDSNQRQVGKVMDLSGGFQGGVGAFQSMAKNYRVKVSNARAQELVSAFRSAHPRTKQLWYDVETAAVMACERPGSKVTIGKLSFAQRGPFLYMKLPSGRLLTFPYARVQELPAPWGDLKPTLTFKTTINSPRHVIEDPNNTSKWARVSTYGGSLIENAVQAIARDLLRDAMRRMKAAGFDVVLTVHDEIVSETSADRDLDEFKRLLTIVPDWAKGLPVHAKSWCGTRYKKD